MDIFPADPGSLLTTIESGATEFDNREIGQRLKSSEKNINQSGITDGWRGEANGTDNQSKNKR